MRVAVVGGSGRFGSTLAWRLATQGCHVVIGSRSAERAVNAAGLLAGEVASGAAVEGARNADAVSAAEVVLLCVPAQGHRDVLREIAAAAPGRAVVDTCVCHHSRWPGRWAPPAEGSAAARVRRLLPASAAVAATLHSVHVDSLRRPDRHPPSDVLLAADGDGGRDAAEEVLRLLGLPFIHAGDLRAAPALEHLAILLQGLGELHGARAPGVRFHGLTPPGRGTDALAGARTER